jgi:hypothetical protein
MAACSHGPTDTCRELCAPKGYGEVILAQEGPGWPRTGLFLQQQCVATDSLSERLNICPLCVTWHGTDLAWSCVTSANHTILKSSAPRTVDLPKLVWKLIFASISTRALQNELNKNQNWLLRGSLRSRDFSRKCRGHASSIPLFQLI